MKIITRLALLAALTASPALAQEVRGTAKATVAGKGVSVEYGRPSLGGRDMLGKAQAGTPWRMGSGSPTSLKTDADLAFGSVALPKGTYVLTAVKDDKGSWTMIASNPDNKAEVAKVPLTSSTLKDSVEQFTIDLSGKGNAGEFAMSWGLARMAASFTAK
jgi:hypothetical protein